MTGPSSGTGTAVAAALGASAALLLWLALAAPLAMGLVHPWPVPPPHEAPAIAPRQPARGTVGATHRTAAILLSQAGTEITDFLAPYAILTASGAFTAVHAVAPTLDVVPLNGGLGVVPELTLEQLDARYPAGVDVVVLPNVLDPESPLLRDWVRRQAAQGAQVASICEGARLLAGTGLLDGRAATSHWAALGSLREAHPTVHWRDDRRWVEDGPFLTSAGVTAAIDASLRLVARATGDETAARTATALHLPPPRDAASPPTELSARDGVTAVLDAGFVWPKRRVLVPLDDGVAELPLAALLDAWPRTFAARAASVSPDRRAVRSRSGLVLVPMLDASAARDGDLVLAPSVAGEPAFDAALRSIARELGGAPAALAARQLELPAAHLRLEDFPTSRAGALLALALLLATGAGAGVALRRYRQRRRARRASAKDDGAHALRDAAPSA